jgi:hypothetical protein
LSRLFGAYPSASVVVYGDAKHPAAGKGLRPDPEPRPPRPLGSAEFERDGVSPIA